MKNNAISYWLVLAIGILLFGACKDKEEVKPIPESSVNQILFELNYTNYAWGFVFDNSFITTEGKVLNHSKGGMAASNPIDWNFPDDDGFISQTDLEENFAKADSLILEFDGSLLEGIPELIEILEEDLTDPAWMCADFGEYTIWAYRWDSGMEKYQRKLVKQCGDAAIDNQSDIAIQLLEKLEDLPIQLVQGCCL